MNLIKHLFLFIVFAVCLGITQSYADGFIIVEPPPHFPRPPRPGHFAFAPLEVTYHHVDVEIQKMNATTIIDQEFLNPNGIQMEGTYIFPVPELINIQEFEMEIDGKKMLGELLPAEKAQKIYHDIVKKMKDPALLEYVGRNAIRVKIFPIAPHGKKRIKIKYSQLLKYDSNLFEYVYPLNTEKFSSRPIPEVKINVKIKTDFPLRTIYCPTHKTEILRSSENQATLSFIAKNERPDTDFKIIFSENKKPLSVDLKFFKENKEDGYFMLLSSPGLTPPAKVQPKDICFVLDSSGSMNGEKIKQAKKSLHFCLNNLNSEDRFEIIQFATEANGTFNQLKNATEENLSTAKQQIDQLKARGGTAIDEALQKALKLNPNLSERPYLIIFLTDGCPTIGETREDPLVEFVKKNNTTSTRIFSFGIGNDVNTHLLDRIATTTKAISQYVANTEDIEIKISHFYSKIKDPVFCDLKLQMTSCKENENIQFLQMHPQQLPDLFNGDVLTLFGRFKTSSQGPTEIKIKLSGQFGGESRDFEETVILKDEKDANNFIPHLWASRRIGWLLDEIRLNGESQELKDEITQLARRFGIITPYTAFLIVEDEQKREIPVALRSMKELEEDRNILSHSKQYLDSLDAEANSESTRSGAQAVQNAISMKQQQNKMYVSQEKSHILKKQNNLSPSNELGYRESLEQNYTTQSKYIANRTFFLNNGIWVDSLAQNKVSCQKQAIEFGSEDYFKIIEEHPEVIKILALGTELDLVIDNILYQIRLKTTK